MISRTLKWAALALLVASAADAKGSARQQPQARREGSALPPVTRLAEWRDKQFFGARPHHAVAIVTKALGSAPGYTAYGVDVDQKKVVFRIALTGAEALTFSADLNRQLYDVSNANPASGFIWEVLGQYVNPPPPPPNGPGGDGQLARKLISVATRNIATQVHELTVPSAPASHQ
jgi:hypothetical protein